MPSPRKFNPDLSASCPPRRKRGRPAKPAEACSQPEGATVTQATKDRLLGEATACFGASVEPEVLKAWLAETLVRFLAGYPFWFGRTPSADAASRAKTRRYLIERGVIQPNEIPKGFVKKRQEWAELTLDEAAASEQASTRSTGEKKLLPGEGWKPSVRQPPQVPL